MHNAHILRTVQHFIRKADLFGLTSFTAKEKRLYRKCYNAMEEDVRNRSKQLNEKPTDMVATLQFCFPWHMQITVEQRVPLRWYNDGHTVIRTPCLVIYWPIPSYDLKTHHTHNNTLFTFN